MLHTKDDIPVGSKSGQHFGWRQVLANNAVGDASVNGIIIPLTVLCCFGGGCACSITEFLVFLSPRQNLVKGVQSLLVRLVIVAQAKAKVKDVVAVGFLSLMLGTILAALALRSLMHKACLSSMEDTGTLVVPNSMLATTATGARARTTTVDNDTLNVMVDCDVK